MRKKRLVVPLLVIGLALTYVVSFGAIARCVHITYLGSDTVIRPQIGYFFSHNATCNNIGHAVYWPLGKLLELWGPATFLDHDPEIDGETLFCFLTRELGF